MSNEEVEEVENMVEEGEPDVPSDLLELHVDLEIEGLTADDLRNP